MLTRRGLIGALSLLLAVGLLMALPGGLVAQDKVAKIGLSFPLTGADADSADSIVKGAQMAIEEINQKGGVAGYKLEGV
ncbi:MAG: ABC transporter substrate-binding protein, partial [Candidatus Rokuibacteriota bacterium]